MPKERKPSVRQQGNPNPGFLLERRSRNAGGKAGTAATKAKLGGKKGDELVVDSDIRPLSIDAFIEILNRYCRRFLRDGKNFSLASLRILEYERVKATAGNELADQLDRLGANVVCSALRGEDRICFVDPAQYLVLMPGTIYDDAYRAMERAALTIGEKTLRHKSQIIRPSATFRVTSPSNPGGTSSDTDLLAATESLLGDVGYALSAHNQLIDRALRDCTSNGVACKVFTGSFESWFDRYKKVGERLTDTWSPEKGEVVMTVWEPSADTESGVNHEALLRRLRALQSIEHPAFCRVTDFYLSSDWKVSLITPKVEGVELTGRRTNKKTRKQNAESLKDATDLTILNWAVQICNALIAAQAMSPPLVLSSFSKVKVRLSPKDRIVLSDFEAEYLQTAFDELTSHDRKVKKANGFGAELAQFLLELIDLKDEKARSDKPLTEFRDLLATLAAHQGNGEKFSLYKLRSTLKAIQESSV